MDVNAEEYNASPQFFQELWSDRGLYLTQKFSRYGRLVYTRSSDPGVRFKAWLNAVRIHSCWYSESKPPAMKPLPRLFGTGAKLCPQLLPRRLPCMNASAG